MRLTPFEKRPGLPKLHRFVSWLSNWRSSLRTPGIVAVTAVATFIVTIDFMYLNPMNFAVAWTKAHGATQRKDIWETLPELPGRLLDIASNEVPRLFFDIKFKRAQKLERKRAEALKRGQLVQNKDDFVLAKIRYLDRTIPVKLRLKGDWVDHLQGEKWSFRIHTRKKDHLLGMRRFSIQNPATRGYQGEVIFFKTLSRLGVLVPRYRFVDVVINGKAVGIMALEEHFSKEMLEFNGRREGVIIRFDEDLLWKDLLLNGPPLGKGPYGHYQNAPIKAFRTSRILKSTRLTAQYLSAVGLLRGFLNKSLSASQVFDVDLLAAYLATVQLWGTQHAVIWHNQRFYYNPITAKLEPVAFDASIQNQAKPGLIVDQQRKLMAEMLKDPLVFKSYERHLQQLIKQVMDGSLIKELKETEKTHLRALQKEYYFMRPYDFSYLGRRARMLSNRSKSRAESKPKAVPSTKYHQLVHAYLIKDKKGKYLEIVNAVAENVDVLSAVWVPNKQAKTIPLRLSGGKRFPLELPPRNKRLPQNGVKLYYDSSASSSGHLVVVSRLKGDKKRFKTVAKIYSAPSGHVSVPRTRVEQVLLKHPYLSLKKGSRQLLVKPGSWRVRSSLVVPVGYKLTIPMGVQLSFSKKASLISYGSTEFNGSKNSPVVLSGVGKKTWLGIAVYGGGNLSRWSYTTVRNTSGVGRGRWQLTGGVTFYKSEVEMDTVRFEGNRSEDALNLIHSQFNLENVTVVNAVSDGFDADYSNGSIVGGFYSNVGLAGGGDGVDLSGSKVRIEGVRFINIGDKAISVGERSHVRASGLFINKAAIAVASKDGSHFEIIDSHIKNISNAGLMAYIKKKEYGPASLIARNLVFTNTPIESRIQKGNQGKLDDKLLPTVELDVRDLYSQR